MPIRVICNPPRIKVGFRCVLPKPVCFPPLVRSPISGNCIAPIIIDPTPEPDCLPPFIYSDRAGGCIKPTPRPVRRDNIAWIQSCLNSLGYNSGVEDGIAGRQTGGAWSAFRRDNGLSGSASYTSPRTLALLYQQCQSPSQKPQPVMPQPRDPAPVEPAPVDPGPPPVEVPPQPEPNQTDLTGLNYRGAMCATGPLHTLLQGQYGDSVQLEHCGASCIPVPEGLSQQDAERQQRDNGVNWCTDCVSVGNKGLLCPLPAETPPQQ